MNVPAGTYYENLVMAEGVDVDGAGQEETYLVGTVYFDGLTDAVLSGMALVDPGWVSSSSPYTTTYGVGVNSGAASLSELGIYYYQYGIQVGAGTTVTIDGNTLARNWYAMAAPTPSIWPA